MKIYTKAGDKGQTKLVDGRECSKASVRVETYGSVDELNSSLGLAIARLKADRLERLATGAEEMAVKPLTTLEAELRKIQNQLFNIGSHLACEKEETRKMLPAFDEAWIEVLEKSIDQMTEQLPPLKNFILPGGALSASVLHVARTICRRAERMVVRLLEETSPETGPSQPENERALRYLNRLSDYLFVAARFANQSLGVLDQTWQKS